MTNQSGHVGLHDAAGRPATPDRQATPSSLWLPCGYKNLKQFPTSQRLRYQRSNTASNSSKQDLPFYFFPTHCEVTLEDE